jgi:copper chaperone CopZ
VQGIELMLLEIVAGLLGSQLVRAVATELAMALLCQGVQRAVTTMAQPRTTPGAAPTSAPAPAAPDGAAGDLLASLVHGAADQAATPELRMVPSIEVISDVPGRVRLRVHGLHANAARAGEVAATVRALGGVTSAKANPRTGTLLVHFDPELTSVAEIVAELQPPLPARQPSAAERAPYLRLVVG